MRQDQREKLRRRFRHSCGYCREEDVGAELTVDHFQPRAHGGGDEPDSWVYCCHACNEFKGDFWQAQGPNILHPLQDRQAEHLAEQDDGILRPLTERGALHIELLHLNRSQLVAYRQQRRLLAAARMVRTRLLERLAQLEEVVTTLTAQVEELKHGDGAGG